MPVRALVCDNLWCVDPKQRRLLNGYISYLINCCLDTGRETIPQTDKSGSKAHSVETNMSNIIDRIWVDSGRPCNGHVAQIMRQTRSN